MTFEEFYKEYPEFNYMGSPTSIFEEVIRNELKNQTCENCKHFYIDKNKDTHCSEIGWHISMYDYEDEDKEYHGRIYVDKDFGCRKGWEKKDD